jgi:hypothetical protein
MVKDGTLIGAIGIYLQKVAPFSDKDVELVESLRAKQSSPSRMLASQVRSTRPSNNGSDRQKFVAVLEIA